MLELYYKMVEDQNRYTKEDQRKRYVILHHEMSRNVPDGHFQVYIFSESKFYTMAKSIFRSED